MRPAIIYNEQDIFVEFTPENFIKLLKTYLKKTKNIDAAMEMIIADLKRETVKK